MYPENQAKLITPPKLAKQLGIDASVVRTHYRTFGGFKLGTRIYFTEDGVKHALQRQTGQLEENSVDRAGNNQTLKWKKEVILSSYFIGH